MQSHSVTTSNVDRAAAHPDHEYEAFLAAVRARFASNLAGVGGPILRTDASGLFQAFLAALPAADRQHYTCHCCRRFFEAYGPLAFADDEGLLHSAFWSAADIPAYFRDAVARLDAMVRGASVVGVFLSAEEEWGTPATGPWRHFAVTPPADRIHRHAYRTAGQVAAERLEDYRTLRRALADFTPEVVDRALQVLETDALYRGEKVRGPIRWLHDLRARIDASPHRRRPGVADNIIWKAVATAPPGYAKPRAAMAGTLLEDLAAGMDFQAVSARFRAKMHPLQYQRPQAAPAAGNIAQAEKIVEAMDLKPALRRRYATLDDVRALWRPRPAAPPADQGSVFGHLTPKGAAPATPLSLPPTNMSWTKFREAVLPGAESIEFFVPNSRFAVAVLSTAVDPEAPPLLQWDSPGRRNPVAWYVWSGGSTAAEFRLTPSSWVAVDAVALGPPQWDDEQACEHQGRQLLLFLRGAGETRASSLSLFPECLRSELREVRATIEAFSRAGRLEGDPARAACAADFRKGSAWTNCRVRVTSRGMKAEYVLDRWD